MMMYTSAKAALGTCTNLATEYKVLPEDSEYIEKFKQYYQFVKYVIGLSLYLKVLVELKKQVMV